MARITVEDCLEKVANPFDLVMLASQRSHDLAAGAHATYAAAQGKKEKNTVIALREIADGTVATQNLETRLTRKWQRHPEPTLLDFPAPDGAAASLAPGSTGSAGSPGFPALEPSAKPSSDQSAPPTAETPTIPIDRIFEDVSEQDLHE